MIHHDENVDKGTLYSLSLPKKKKEKKEREKGEIE